MSEKQKQFKNTINSWIDEANEEFNNNFIDYTNVEKIKEIIKNNNGYITTKEINKYKIGRDYLTKLVNNNEIERVERGIYIDKDIMQDDFYIFQLNHIKTIYSHFTALYFHNLTETIPYTFDITCENNYFINELKNKNVFYVKKEWLDIGLMEMNDNYGNKIRCYDMERCICDIIRSKKRLDFEQVKKSVKQYLNRKDKNLIALSKYSKIMGIYDDVMNFVQMYVE